jgi:hypothetical protein
MATLRAIKKPGIYQMTAAEYHADPVIAPSLSASLAHILISQSPLHAWWQSPRLNPAYEVTHSSAFDLGTAAHSYLLEGESGCVIIAASDFRSKAAKETRDAAYAVGKTPLLEEKWTGVQGMVQATRRQLAEHQDPPAPFTDGKPEQTIIWTEEGDIWCRARLDWLHEDRRTIDDYKTTSGSANPDAWTRGPLFSNGYDVQAAFYLRGLKAVCGVDAVFRFVVQETDKPYALSVIGLAPSALDLAARKVAAAIEAWRYCLAENRWPGYPVHTCWADAPPWEEARWLEREYRGQPAPVVDDGRPLAEQMFGKGEPS